MLSLSLSHAPTAEHREKTGVKARDSERADVQACEGERERGKRPVLEPCLTACFLQTPTLETLTRTGFTRSKEASEEARVQRRLTNGIVCSLSLLSSSLSHSLTPSHIHTHTLRVRRALDACFSW